MLPTPRGTGFRPAVRLAAVVLAACALAPVAGRPAAASASIEDAPEPVIDLSRPLDLDEALRYAEANSAALRAAEARWRAAKDRVGTVSSLPDPRVTYGYFLDEVETRVGPQTQKIGVRQMLPWFGKLSLRGDMARASAGAEYERYRDARLSLARGVTGAYAEYAYLGRAIEVVRARVELLRGLESVARTRYSSGEAMFADVARAQIELARIENELVTLEDRREPLSATLAALLNLAADEPLPWPTGIPDPGPSVSENEAIELLGSHNTELRVLDLEIERAVSAVSLARRRHFPDLTIGIDYIVTDEAVMPVDESGKDPLIASASVTLPLWFGKHASAVRAARSHEAAKREMREQRARDLEARLETVLFELADAERKVALYENRLLPLARQSYASAEAAYRAGAVGFDGLIGAHEIALEFEIGLARARADRAKKSAEIERLLGRSVPTAPRHE